MKKKYLYAVLLLGLLGYFLFTPSGKVKVEEVWNTPVVPTSHETVYTVTNDYVRLAGEILVVATMLKNLFKD